MDDEWEILPPDVRLEYRVDSVNKKYGVTRSTSRAVSNIVIDANHFVCPASHPRDQKVSSDYGSPREVTEGNDSGRQAPGDVVKVPLEVTLLSPVIGRKDSDLGVLMKGETEEDLVSHVSFKKMMGNEFVDMKLESPTKSHASAARGTLRSVSPPPAVPIDGASYGSEAKMEQSLIVDNLGDKVRSPRLSKSESIIVEHQVAWEEVNNAGLSFWKWSLTGVGAICSFSVVAVATVCILILGSHRNDSNQRAQKQNLRVKIYADDKRKKHEIHQPTKLGDSVLVTREVSFPRTPITYGYFDGL